MTGVTNTTENDLKNYTYNILKRRLINCTYAPGSILNEAHLTSEMKLSRIPVHETVSHLGTEGFVKVIPRKGIHVTDTLLSNVLQIFQIRAEFGPTILRLFMSRLPEGELLYFIQRFENPGPGDTVMDRIRLNTVMHLFTIEHCGNCYMVDIMYRVYDISNRIVFFIHQDHAAVYGDGGRNLEILRLLLNRDLRIATERMHVHAEHRRMTALNYFYTVPDGEAPVKTYRDKLHKKQETVPHPYR